MQTAQNVYFFTKLKKIGKNYLTKGLANIKVLATNVFLLQTVGFTIKNTAEAVLLSLIYKKPFDIKNFIDKRDIPFLVCLRQTKILLKALAHNIFARGKKY